MKHVCGWKSLIAAVVALSASFGYSQQAKTVTPTTIKPDTTTTVTTGGGTSGYIAEFFGASTIGNSIIYATGNSVGIGTIPNSGAKLDVGGSMIMRGPMTVSRTGNATSAKGFPSYGFDFFSNIYDSSTKKADNAYFQLQSEPTGNNTSSPSATFNLLFSNNGAAAAETGFYVNPNGTLHFASAQTFPITQGPAGPAGPQGPAGPAGPKGATGPQGAPGTLNLPYSGQGAANTTAAFTVVNTGTSPDSSDPSGIAGYGGSSGSANDFYTAGTGVAGVGGDATNTSDFDSFGGTGVIGNGGVGDGSYFGGTRGGDGGLFKGGDSGGSSGQGGSGVIAFGGSPNGVGIYATPIGNAYAGVFGGEVYINGTVYQPSEAIKIDHPIDPENKYLLQSSVVSPDMMNVLNGNVLTDAAGSAVVSLPDWFEAMNRDFRYQLTPIGQFAQAMVSSEIANGRFTIRTDKGNVKVSWQVTGIRQDAWANAHRTPVEEEKAEQDRGKFLHPELFGKPDDPSIEESHHPELSRVKRAAAAQ